MKFLLADLVSALVRFARTHKLALAIAVALWARSNGNWAIMTLYVKPDRTREEDIKLVQALWTKEDDEVLQDGTEEEKAEVAKKHGGPHSLVVRGIFCKMYVGYKSFGS